MEQVPCKCTRPAKYVCKGHRVYLCLQHSKTHKACSTSSLFAYIKTVRNQKKTLLSNLKSLKTETASTTSKLQKINREVVSSLTKIRQKITRNLDKIISTFSNKVDKLITFELKSTQEEFIEKTKLLEFGRKYLELGEFLENIKFGKLRKAERAKSAELTELLTVNGLYKDLFDYSKLIEKQSGAIAGGLNKLVITGLKDITTTQTQTYRQISRTIDEQNRFYSNNNENNFSVDNKSPSLKSSFVKIKNIPQGKMFMQRVDSHSLIEDNIRSSVHHLKESRNGLGRGTELIEQGSGFKFHLGKLSGVGKKGLNKKLDSIKKDNFLLRQSLIELEEIEIDESYYEDFEEAGDIEGEIFEKFNNSREKLVGLLKMVLEKVEEEKFFNTGYKTDVNNYLSEFRENGEMVIRDVLLNFNKL